MMQYAYDRHEEVAQFVTRITGGRPFENCKAIGVLNGDGNLIAGVVYHNWRPEAGVIEMSGAALPGSGWLTRETLRRMYEYPFEQLGVQMTMKWVPAEHESLLRQLAMGGHMFVRVPRFLGRDRDCVLCLLTREAWQEMKFIRHKEAA